jgi:hypothetical protein
MAETATRRMGVERPSDHKGTDPSAGGDAHLNEGGDAHLNEEEGINVSSREWPKHNLSPRSP